MVEMVEKESSKVLGTISDEEMNFLVQNLEEETESDEDYYFDADTLEFLKENGMTGPLEKILRDALGSRENMEIIFRKK